MPTRRRLLRGAATIAVGGIGALAGCSGTGDGGTGDDGTDGTDGNGNGDGDGNTPAETATGDASSDTGRVSIEGIESVTVSEGQLTVRRNEGASVDEVRLFNPDNEQLSGHRGGAHFNDVEREVSIPLGTSQPGEYTMVAYTGANNEVGRDTLTLTRSFEVADATYLRRVDWGPAVAFDVRATGDLPLSVTRIEALESSGAFEEIDGVMPVTTASEGDGVWTQTELDAEGVSSGGLTAPGSPRWYWMNDGLRLTTGRDATPPNSCDGWTLQRRYELTVTGGESVVVDLTIDLGGSFQGTEGARSHFVCETGEVAIEGTSSTG